MMKGRYKTKISMFCLAAVIAIMSWSLIACGSNITETPADNEYTYTNPTPERAETDSDIKIDGKLDDEIYKSQSWLNLHKEYGTETADVSTTSVIGDKGIYVAIDVSENTHIYYNFRRSIYYNSGIELYYAVGGSTTKIGNLYEINMAASGAFSIRKHLAGFGGALISETPDKMAYFEVETKGGAVNTADCNGYTMELFLPYALLNIEKPELIYLQPIHISTFDTETTGAQSRNYYSFSELSGFDWNNPSTGFRFDASGAVKHTVSADAAEGGSVKAEGNYLEEVDGAQKIYEKGSVTYEISVDDGYTLDTLTIDGEDYKDSLSFENSKGYLTVYNITKDINLNATFKKVSTQNVNISGSLSYNGTGVESDIINDISVYASDGFKRYDFAIDKTAKTYSATLPTGEYKIYIYSAKEQRIISRADLQAYADKSYNITVSDEMYETQLWKMASGTADITKQDEGKIIAGGGYYQLQTKQSYQQFLFEITAKNYNTNARPYGINILFDDGKEFDLCITNEGRLSVQEAAFSGSTALLGWNRILDFNDVQQDKYNSKGINFGIMRIENKIYVYFDDALIKTYTLNDAYKTLAGKVSLKQWGSTIGAEVEFNFERGQSILNRHINIAASENGSIQTDSQNYTLGQDVTINFTAEENYTIASLIVNGAERINDISGNKLVLSSCYEKQLNISASFEPLVLKDMTMIVKLHKNGSDTTVYANQDVTIVGFGQTYTKTTDNSGLVTFDDIRVGNYTVSFDGYISKAVVFDGTALGELTFEYDFYSVSNESRVDLSRQNDGTVITKGGGYIEVKSKDWYSDFTYTIDVKQVSGYTNDRPYDIWVRFENEKDLDFSIRTDKGLYIENTNWGGILSATGKIRDLTAEETAAYTGENGITLEIRRSGNIFAVYLGGKFVAAYALAEEYADMEAQIGFKMWGTIAGISIPFTVSDTADLSSTVSVDSNIANGSVTADKTAYQMGQSVILTIEGNSGYIVSSITVDGAEKIYSLTSDGKYVFTALKEEYSVSAQFVQAVSVDLTTTISANKYGESVSLTGETVTLIGMGVTKTAVVGEQGALNIAGIYEGNYNVLLEGYITKSITVSGNSLEAIVLEYITFKVESGSVDLSNQNSGSIKSNGGYISVWTNDSFDAASIKIIAKNQTTNGRPYNLMLRFDNGDTLDISITFENNTYYVQEASLSGGTAIVGWTKLHTLTSDELALYNGAEGIAFELKRSGNTVEVYFNNALIKSYTIDEKYAEMSVQMGIKMWGSASGTIIPFTITKNQD